MEPADAGAAGDGSPSAPRTPTSRLTRRSEFRRVYDAGRRLTGRHVQLFVLPNAVGVFRLGITVTKRVGGAVVRNRLRRRIREIFRTDRSLTRAALDVVVNVRDEARDAPTRALRAELVRLLPGFRAVGPA